VPKVFSKDLLDNPDFLVMTIYPQEQAELITYNNKKYEWLQAYEIEWMNRFFNCDLSYQGMIRELKESVLDPILAEHRIPSYVILKEIEENLKYFKEMVGSMEKYEPGILILNKDEQLIHNFIAYWVFRQLPNFIGFLESLRSDIERYPSKTKELITKAYKKENSIPDRLIKVKPSGLIDVWLSLDGSKTYYYKVIAYYQTKLFNLCDKPMINPDGSWARIYGSKMFLQAFLATCIKKGYISDNHSAAEFVNILKITFKLDKISRSYFASQALNSIDEKYLSFFYDMP